MEACIISTAQQARPKVIHISEPVRAQVTLRPLHGGGDAHKPEARTCSREVLLPEYSSAAVLREMVLRTLDWHAAPGSGGFYAT